MNKPQISTIIVSRWRIAAILGCLFPGFVGIIVMLLNLMRIPIQIAIVSFYFSILFGLVMSALAIWMSNNKLVLKIVLTLASLGIVLLLALLVVFVMGWIFLSRGEWEMGT